MRESRRQPLAVLVIALIAGISGIVTVTSRPRFASYHIVDVVELVASGMCFGIALVGLVRLWRGEGGT